MKAGSPERGPSRRGRLSVAPVDDDRLARGDVPFDLHDGQQHRSGAKRPLIADQQRNLVQEEDEQDKEILQLTEQMLGLTKEVRSYFPAGSTAGSDSAGPEDDPPPAR